MDTKWGAKELNEYLKKIKVRSIDIYLSAID
jgi:hypothetical protein